MNWLVCELCKVCLLLIENCLYISSIFILIRFGGGLLQYGTHLNTMHLHSCMDSKAVFSNQVLPQLLLNPNKIRLRRCRCAIYFDCVPEPFRVSDKINGSRTHLVNPKNDLFFGLCERCRGKQREFKVKNADHKKEVDKAYCLREDIKERRREKEQTPEFKEWRRKNQQQPHIVERKKEYNQRPEVIEKRKEYSERKKEYNKRPEVREKVNARFHERYHNDMVFRFRFNLSAMLNKKVHAVLNDKMSDKNTMEYLGCSIREFMDHIEDQFQPDMTWDNYGRIEGTRCWELDHIIPAMYREDGREPTVEDLKKRSHYTNFQPLWADENESKGNRFIGKMCDELNDLKII